MKTFLQRFGSVVRGVLHGFDRLRFRGAKAADRVRKDGRRREDLTGEITTRMKELVEGTRVKHHINNNQLKMYDNIGRVLGIETVLRAVRDFKVYATRRERRNTCGCVKGWRT
jgi:hypothetical protein